MENKILENWMMLALQEAEAGIGHGDIPIGAVAVIDGQLIASRHNERELQNDPTAHAEILVLRDAAAKIGSWHLENTTIITTLEPCPMCAGALVAARIKRLIFGALDPKTGACGSLYNLCGDPRLNYEIPIVAGVMAEDSSKLLESFFKQLRNRSKRHQVADIAIQT
ncbi:MAG: tRNA adenosine(34) deaminase TadA [Actinobacteria bacterium]|nr:tRNA adenosine(34) deaminase TadA [Actinomycetota bacterium]MCL6105591.1 tRNA adenosine(34) deaminase TadA [Actinomycetota bacterium]